jgi:hypothetical protein
MPTRHDVQQGDCLSSIAAQYGISWEKIWNHGDNADLKQRRKDPNVLFPGDVVSVPDKDPKKQACAVDKHHKFKTKRKPTRIKIRLTLDDEPRKNLRYELQVAGQTLTGSTDGAGYLEAQIPSDAQSGVLLVGDGDPRETYQLGLGTLDPLDTDDGVKKRLTSLGLDAEDDLPGAIRGFQVKHNLEATGTVDDALRQKLKEKFGQ